MSEELKKLMELLSSQAFSSSARIGILLALLYLGKMSFADLLRSLDLPKSSLYAHIQVLEDAGLISVRKVFTVDGPRTIIQLTDKGEEEVMLYISLVKQLKFD